jgi:hypothetical protein
LDVRLADLCHRLPLDTVMLVISELLPKVQEMQAARHKQNPAANVMDFLGNVSLKHVLPPTPPLAPRKFTVCLLAILLVSLVDISI